MEHPRPSHAAGSATVVRTMQLALHALFAVLLIVGAVRGVASSGHPVWVGVAAALVAGWYVAGLRAARHEQVWVGIAWLVVLIAGWVALIALSTEFSWVAFALFFLALHVLPRGPAVGAVALITAVVIAAQLAAGSMNGTAGVIGPCMGAVVAVGISWIYSGLRAEAQTRQHLVDELIASQDAQARAQREAGVLAERSRLARDIHDTLAQSFSSIVLLSRAGLAGQPDAARLHDLMTQIDDTASAGLRDARIVVRALAPDELGEAPLPGALRRLLDPLAEQGGLTVDLVIDGTARPLPTTVEVALLRLAQGALANVRQHAAADTVTLTITFHDDAVQLDIVDDGVGFDPATRLRRTGGGFGLRAMHERLAELGGTVTIESEPGEGTAVSAGIPLDSVMFQEDQP